MGETIPFAEYQQIAAVNWSTLTQMRKSPLHYQHALVTPREDTPRLALGRAAHAAVFEPERFVEDYVMFNGDRRAGKVWEAFAEKYQDKTILKREEYQACTGMCESVRSNKLAMSYLVRGLPEHSITWTDPGTGLACKSRLDWLSHSLPAITDLKTTADIEPRRFSGTAARMGYHCQLAFYREGVRVLHGENLPVVIVAVEQAPPHDVAVYLLDEDALYAGWSECQRLLERVARCRSANQWPGRFDAPQTLRLPQWVWDDDEDTTGLDLEVTGQSLGG